MKPIARAPYSRHAINALSNEAAAAELVRMVVLSSLDPDAPHEGWVPVKPEDVPQALKDDVDVMGYLKDGLLCQLNGNGTWYRGMVVNA